MKIKRDNLKIVGQKVQTSMEKNKVPGVALACFHKGELICTETFGFADPSQSLPVSTQTHFEAASLTKPVFAWLVLRLADSGVLQLDVPLHKYLPDNPPSIDPRFSAVTAEHILSHGTGLPNWGETPLSLAFAPGCGFRYSGKGYEYLQTIVEQLTGHRLDALMQAEVFDPLGMQNAAMIWTRPLNRTLARTWDENGNTQPPRSSVYQPVGIEPNAAFSLYVTIDDYPQFIKQILLEDNFAERVRKIRNPAKYGVEWGLGWGLNKEILWHWGDNGGFKSFICVDPETKDAILIHTNGTNGLHTCFDIAGYCTDFDFSEIANMITRVGVDI